MLSKSGIHAIRALVALAQVPDGEYQGASVIAQLSGAPPNYLGKLLQQLSKQGILQSQKGLRGGFRLARPPEDVSLFDVVESIEDVGRWTACILGRKDCSDEDPCSVHHRWGPVRDAYLQLLRGTAVSDLVPTPKTDQ